MKPLRSSRALVALLLAVLLAGRMVVPTGWMPVRTGEGFAIMLCSGSGAGQAWVDTAGKLHQGHKPEGKSEAKDPCPYGAISAPAALPAAPQLAALAPVPSPAPAPALPGVAVGRGLAAPPPPATGPPLSA
ncbi:hypothetical protein ACFOD9_02370 [Novosphingobium bradum]|uniref:DUF2946 domain-containing protein n=1 Tax=Novosphingobium bradum TaxID=1737444 RepID=A0ABV7IK61_9SPHN